MLAYSCLFVHTCIQELIDLLSSQIFRWILTFIALGLRLISHSVRIGFSAKTIPVTLSLFPAHLVSI